MKGKDTRGAKRRKEEGREEEGIKSWRKQEKTRRKTMKKSPDRDGMSRQ